MLEFSLALARRIEARRGQGCCKTEMARPKGTAKATSLKSLLPRQAAFVREYVGAGCKNAKQAAIRAGYAGGASAEVTASRLLRNPKVVAEIEKAQGRLFRRHEISADRVMRGITNTAFFDPIECFDQKGDILPLHRMPKRARQAISRFEVTDGAPTKLSFRDRLNALRILIDLVGPLKLPPNPPSAPPAEEERVSVEEFRRRAGMEREGKMPPPDEG
jgi:phage terminase small subunit